MFTQDPPKLKVLLRNEYLDIEDAVKRENDFVLETLIGALLLLPLSSHTLTRIKLGDCFRRSLQSSRKTTPYRLHTIISGCKAGTVDKASLEAKFFEHGGVRTVTALAAAAADDKQIVGLLNGLSDAEFLACLKSIDAIEPHRDFLFIIETLERKRPSRLSKRKHVPGPRPPRGHHSHIPGSVPQALPKNLVVKVHQHARYSAQEPWFCQMEAGSRNSVPVDVATSHTKPLNNAQLTLPSTFGKSQGKETSITAGLGQIAPNAQATGINNIALVAFQQNDGAEMLQLCAAEQNFSQGKSSAVSSITSGLTDSWQCDGNYRIDLDNVHSTLSYDTDAENSNFEHYAIDLDSFNAL